MLRLIRWPRPNLMTRCITSEQIDHKTKLTVRENAVKHAIERAAHENAPLFGTSSLTLRSPLLYILMGVTVTKSSVLRFFLCIQQASIHSCLPPRLRSIFYLSTCRRRRTMRKGRLMQCQGVSHPKRTFRADRVNMLLLSAFLFVSSHMSSSKRTGSRTCAQKK